MEWPNVRNCPSIICDSPTNFLLFFIRKVFGSKVYGKLTIFKKQCHDKLAKNIKTFEFQCCNLQNYQKFQYFNIKMTSFHFRVPVEKPRIMLFLEPIEAMAELHNSIDPSH